MSITREHIILTLGIDLPLNESLDNLNESLQNRILYEQRLYESFIDSIKKYAQDKWDKTLTTLKDWKDAAVVLGKTISNPEMLNNFSNDLWKTFKRNTFERLKSLLEKLKLNNLIPQVTKIIDKITNLTGWQKFLAATSIASIATYIVTELSSLSTEGLKKWIIAYFSDEVLKTIFSKLIDFSTFVGWLQPIIKGTEILFDVLGPTINKFKTSLSFFKENINTMKKSELKQLIKEEIFKIVEAEVVSSTTPTTPSSTTTSPPQQQKQSPEVKKLVDYLNNAGKSALGNINNRTELNQILTAVWNGMNETMKKDSSAKSVYNIISQKIK